MIVLVAIVIVVVAYNVAASWAVSKLTHRLKKS